MAPHRTAVCDSMRRIPPISGTKKTNLVVLASNPKGKSASSATHPPPASPLLSMGIGGSEKHKSARSKPLEKYGADSHFSGAESEISRSSTPFTDMSRSFPSSTSSFAVPMQARRENDSPKGTIRGQSDGESSDSDSDSGYRYDKSRLAFGELNRLGDEDMAAGKQAPRPYQLRSSQVRQSLSTDAPIAPAGPENDLGQRSQVDEDSDDTDTEDESDASDWGSENDSFDMAIVATLEGDIGLAVSLIPFLHKLMRKSVQDKVDSWQIEPADPIDGGDGLDSSTYSPGSIHGNRGPKQVSGAARKRRRHSESDNDQDDDDDDEKGGNGDTSLLGLPQEAQDLLLACPFHKFDPMKYGIQHLTPVSSRKDTYRACAGPGFKTIQRLKEHLKRKHTPVQCDRCYHIFHGLSKPSRARELTRHRQREEPCQRGDPSLKEGISEEQWEALERQNHKKNQEKHKFERWFDIWQILFPEAPLPVTPLYDAAVPMGSPSNSNGRIEFMDIFQHILAHKVQLGDVNFDNCSSEDVQERLRNIVGLTFQAYVSVHGPNFAHSADVSSITGTTPLLPSVSEEFQTAQQSLSDNSTHPYTLTASAQTIGGLAGASSPHHLTYSDPPLQESPSLSGRFYNGNTGEPTAAVDSGGDAPYSMRGVPITEASLMQSLPYVLIQPGPDQASRSQQAPHPYQTAQTAPNASQASRVLHTQHATHHAQRTVQSPPSQHSSRGSRSQRTSKSRRSRSEKQALPPLLPALHQDSQQESDLVSSAHQAALPPSSLHMQLLQDLQQTPYATNMPQQAHATHGHHGQHEHYGHYGHSAGPSMPGTADMGAHMQSPCYAQYGQHEASDYYNRLPWTAGGMSQGHAAVSLPPMETRPYDTMPSMGHQATGTGYYTSHSGYAGPHHEDDRSHQ